MKQSYRTVAIAASGALLAAVAANILRHRSRAGRMKSQTLTVALDRDTVATALADDVILARALECDAIEMQHFSEPDVFEWRCRDHGERHVARMALIDAPRGRGTELHIAMHGPKYDAKEIVRRLKYLLESGEIPTGAYTA